VEDIGQGVPEKIFWYFIRGSKSRDKNVAE